MDFTETGKNYEIHCGDSLVLMDEIPENTFDTCITDPPYHLTSITKRFGKENSAPAKYGKDGAFSRLSKGFMGKEWDGGGISFDAETWRKVYRVMKPGGTLLCFGGTRTYHRIAVAIEDAGFIIKDTIMWVYGSGFPKSYNISKGMSAKQKIGTSQPQALRKARMGDNYKPTGQKDYKKGRAFENIPSDNYVDKLTPEAQLWDGWGTALKPAYEPIIVAMKPLDGTYVDNALKWGVAGMWIDGGRIETEDDLSGGTYGGIFSATRDENGNLCKAIGSGDKGRWPANFILSYPEDEYELRDDITPEQLRELARWLDENA